MNSAFTLTLLLSLLIAAVYCNHEHNHHNNHGDDKWITFVSQIESFWKTETPEKSSEIYTESTLNNKDFYSSEKTSEGGLLKSVGVITNPPVVNLHDISSKSSFNDDMRRSQRIGLGAALGITAVGVIIIISCCCCIFKGCFGMCGNRQQGHVIGVNSNMAYQPPIPQPTQVIVQPPIYQQVSPPQQMVHQYPPPPQMQYGQQQFLQHGQQEFLQHGQQEFLQHGQQQFQQQMTPPPQYSEFPQGGIGIENPNYNPSAPLHSLPEKY